ncbi:MAG: hypothetical protein LC798_16885 [Chloroflexi bacterium]|nr:hypothetical protein [Chloroflexota bacterium]
MAEEKPAKPLPSGCLAPIIVAVVIMVAFMAFCFANLGGGENPSPAYEACSRAVRAGGLSEDGPDWLCAVGRCMERIDPTTTRP